jgi:predicted aspartyl protease
MPFELVSNFLVVVRGQAGDLEGLRFILDTGASSTWIDEKVADHLQLQRTPGKVMNFDREIPVEWAEIPMLQVGPVRAERLRVAVKKLGDYSEFAAGVDGIIGLDLLSKTKKIFINYETQEISFELAHETDDSPSPRCFIVRLAVQGLPVRLALDTGFQGILLYKDRLHKGLPQLLTEGVAENMTMGRLQATRVKLPGVRIFGSESVQTVFLIDGPSSNEMSGLDGCLGIASLHARRIELDFAAKELRWQ